MITDFAAARNRLLSGRSERWVLFLDSDESLSAPIRYRHLNPKFNYAFFREDWFLGRRLKFGETATVTFTRLVQPGTGRWVGRVHERFVSDLPVKVLPQKIIHRRKITLAQFWDRLNYYSGIRAEEISRFSLFELLVYPPVKFVKNYIGHLGFLDGMPGLIMALMMSLHSLFVRVKVYEKTR